MEKDVWDIWAGTGKYSFKVFDKNNVLVYETEIVFTHFRQYTHWLFITAAKYMRENDYYARVEGSRIA